MRWNNGGYECFRVVTPLTVRIHFFFVSDAYAYRMTRSTGVAIRLDGNRRRQNETLCGMRIRNRTGSKSNFMCEYSDRREGGYGDHGPDKNCERPRTNQIPGRNPVESCFAGMRRPAWVQR